jgi:hypothetical protein
MIITAAVLVPVQSTQSKLARHNQQPRQFPLLPLPIKIKRYVVSLLCLMLAMLDAECRIISILEIGSSRYITGMQNRKMRQNKINHA